MREEDIKETNIKTLRIIRTQEVILLKEIINTTEMISGVMMTDGKENHKEVEADLMEEDNVRQNMV